MIHTILLGDPEDLVERGGADLIDIFEGVGVRAGQQVGPPAAASRLIALKHDRVDPDSSTLHAAVGSRRVAADVETAHVHGDG